jgi:putative transposase
VVRLFIIDGAKSKAIRRTFGRNTPIQRCQVHKARNIAERLPKEAQARVRKALRQAWEMEDAARCMRRRESRPQERRRSAAAGGVKGCQW